MLVLFTQQFLEILRTTFEEKAMDKKTFLFVFIIIIVFVREKEFCITFFAKLELVEFDIIENICSCNIHIYIYMCVFVLTTTKQET